MADTSKSAVKARRIWTRCLFCSKMTDKPSNHLDSYAKGCRASLENSGSNKKDVIARMRDEAYRFTAYQAIDPAVPEKILRQYRAGKLARLCMLDILKKLNIEVCVNNATLSMDDSSSTASEEDRSSSYEHGDGLEEEALHLHAENIIKIRWEEDPDVEGQKDTDEPPATSQNVSCVSGIVSSVAGARLSIVEDISTPLPESPPTESRPVTPTTKECRVRLSRRPDIEKVSCFALLCFALLCFALLCFALLLI